MKHIKGIVISTISIAVLAVAINWGYLYHLFDLSLKSAAEIVSNEHVASDELRKEMSELSAGKIIRFVKVPESTAPGEPTATPNSTITFPTGTERGMWDYSDSFDTRLKEDFNPGAVIYFEVTEDLHLAQVHNGGEIGIDRSIKYWTTEEEYKKMKSVEEYMDKMALLTDWGPRTHVSFAYIPAGTKVKYAVGTAKAQKQGDESRPGNGIQYLFAQFDEAWITDTQKLPTAQED